MTAAFSVRMALLALAAGAGLSPGFSPARAAAIESVPLAQYGTPLPGQSLFTRLGPELTRLEYSHGILGSHPNRRLYATAFASGNIALGDLDLDGLPDLFVSGGPGSNKVYLQAERLVFVDVTAGLQISDSELWASAGVLVDIDNDSDLDVYVCYYDQPNRLYINQIRETGRLWFKEQAQPFGLDIKDASLVPAFADYDCDGDLDLYLLTHQLVRENGRPATPVKLEKDSAGNGLRITGELSRYYELDDPAGSEGDLHYHETGRPDYLLRNDKGKFLDVTRQAGLDRAPRLGCSVVWWDANSDGHPDLYIANDGPDPDLYYRNNQDGTFTLESSALPRTPAYSRGSTLLDADGDGLPDLFVSGVLADTHFKRQITLAPPDDGPAVLWHRAGGAAQVPGNALFLQTPGARFREAAWLAGLAATGSTSAVKAGDYDQDGREDLFLAAGALRNFKMADLPRPTHEQLAGKTLWDFYESLSPEKRELNRTFRNAGGLRFDEVSREWGLGYSGVTHTCSQGDLDNDGDLDLVVSSLGEPLVVYRNETTTRNSLRVRLRGTQSNSHGIGARLSLVTPSGTQVRELRCGGGFLDGDEPALHFGTGPHKEVLALEVRWPSGLSQRFTNLPANHLYTVSEEKSPIPARVSPPAPWFSSHPALDHLTYAPPSLPGSSAGQPLLPFSFSHNGPSQSWADVDADGDLDLMLGSSLFLNQSSPLTKVLRFDASRQRSLEPAETSGEGASIFLDADGDGDPDLYLASTTADPSPDPDRLLMNWEHGVMGHEPERLPATRTPSFAAAAADFDRDGDIDFFASGRPKPNSYPLSLPGCLYRNDSGTFREVSAELAPCLSSAGLVSSATWTDLDADGWPDLVLAHAWGPLQILHNQSGRFAPWAGTGLEKWEGLWNGVASADLDQDGDLDLVATNLGLNTPYRASADSPALLFFGTFGGMDQPRLIEALLEDGVCFPRRNLTGLAPALPFLADRWKSHREFASAPLNLLVPMTELQAATLLKANELRSGVFWNDGKGHFGFTPLPAAAQMAPAFGVAFADVDLDGALDLFLAQNFSFARPGLGPLRGGLSVLFRNDPRARSLENRFQPWSTGESGLALAGDARSAAFVDVNQDTFPDLVLGRHKAAPALFLHRGRAGQAPLTVSLRGLPGNPTAIGARVQVKIPKMPTQIREIQAGSGYLTSIHGGPLCFARPPKDAQTGEADVTVRWPSGETKSYRFPLSTAGIVLDQQD